MTRPNASDGPRGRGTTFDSWKAPRGLAAGPRQWRTSPTSRGTGHIVPRREPAHGARPAAPTRHAQPARSQYFCNHTVCGDVWDAPVATRHTHVRMPCSRARDGHTAFEIASQSSIRHPPRGRLDHALTSISQPAHSEPAHTGVTDSIRSLRFRPVGHRVSHIPPHRPQTPSVPYHPSVPGPAAVLLIQKEWPGVASRTVHQCPVPSRPRPAGQRAAAGTRHATSCGLAG